MSIFTAARKITAARMTGAVTAGAIITHFTKEAAIVCPVVGAVVVAAAIAHRKLAKEDIEEVSVGGLCTFAGVGAAEVAVGSAVGVAAKRFFQGRVNKSAAPEAVSPVETTDIPVEAVDVVTA